MGRGFGGRQPPDLRLSPLGQTGVTLISIITQLSLKVLHVKVFRAKREIFYLGGFSKSGGGAFTREHLGSGGKAFGKGASPQ